MMKIKSITFSVFRNKAILFFVMMLFSTKPSFEKYFNTGKRCFDKSVSFVKKNPKKTCFVILILGCIGIYAAVRNWKKKVLYIENKKPQHNEEGCLTPQLSEGSYFVLGLCCIAAPAVAFCKYVSSKFAFNVSGGKDKKNRE